MTYKQLLALSIAAFLVVLAWAILAGGSTTDTGFGIGYGAFP